jgi:hypothetical protein
MFAKLKSWLGNPPPPPPTEPPPSAPRRAEPAAVPPQARELARRLLALVLDRLGAGERASDIEEMDIAEHRVLLQLLPLRVYVYALGSMMADHDFESILSSQRPSGAVFDAFEIDIEGVHCGFYVYSLSALSDRDALNEIWSALREEIGRPVNTAKLPPEHTRHHLRAEVIRIEGDPDTLADQLLAPSQPTKFLDQVSIVDNQGIADFVAQLFLRMGKASIEKDELIRFVERNRSHFNETFMQLLTDATEAAAQTDESTGVYFGYVSENIRLALARDFDRMDMRSDRLFWLVFALDQLLESEKIDLTAARSHLARPDTAQRISQHQLLYMIHDFAQALDSPQEPAMSMMLLIGECALIGGHAAPLKVACKILSHRTERLRREEVVDLLTRAIAWLRNQGEDTDDLAEQLQRQQDRTRRIPDEDF